MQQAEGKNFIPYLGEISNEPLIYDCPKKAAQVAGRLTKLKGVKFQPRPVIEADTWKLREQQRFADGKY